MNVLITGGLGFVARHLAPELEDAGHHVIKTDIRYADGCHYCDLRDLESTRRLIQAITPDACIHLGGIAFVPTGWQDPERVYSSNLMGTLHLLEAFRHERPDARILAVSSSLIYQNANTGNPLNETAYMYPPDIYAISKIAGDLTALGYANHYDMQVMTARPINHIGPGRLTSTR
jgi:GDP-4-dehydro-6-deoxy-D-mannose reductase